MSMRRMSNHFSPGLYLIKLELKGLNKYTNHPSNGLPLTLSGKRSLSGRQSSKLPALKHRNISDVFIRSMKST